MKSRLAIRHFVAIGLVLVAAVVLYAFVVPKVVASHYLSKLNQELGATDKALDEVAGGVSAPIFTDPDVTLAEREVQLQSAMNQVTNTKNTLQQLDTASQFSPMPGGDVTKDYRTATVRHMQSQNLIAQSGEVLDEYHSLLAYLQTYTELQQNLQARLDTFNETSDFNALIGSGDDMLYAADTIQADADKLQTMPIPASFEPLKTEVVSTFTQAANGFYQLGYSLNSGDNTTVYNAVASLEAVTTKNTIYDKNLLVSLADSSPILRQVAELPEKAEIAQGL